MGVAPSRQRQAGRACRSPAAPPPQPPAPRPPPPQLEVFEVANSLAELIRGIQETRQGIEAHAAAGSGKATVVRTDAGTVVLGGPPMAAGGGDPEGPPYAMAVPIAYPGVPPGGGAYPGMMAPGSAAVYAPQAPGAGFTGGEPGGAGVVVANPVFKTV